MDSLCMKSSICWVAPPISIDGVFDVGAFPSQTSAFCRDKSPQRTIIFSGFCFIYPTKSLWFGGGGNARHNGSTIDNVVLVEDRESGEEALGDGEKSPELAAKDQSENWVSKILRVSCLWNGKNEKNKNGIHEEKEKQEEAECDACRVDEEEEEETGVQFDRDTFSRLLRKVSLEEARLYAQMSYLGNLSYAIHEIKPSNLLNRPGLHFVTSSIEMKELPRKAGKDQVSDETQETGSNEHEEAMGKKQNGRYQISASVVYELVASAASHLYSHTKSILPFRSSKPEVGEGSHQECSESSDSVNETEMEVASLTATPNSVTAVVAAEEEVKQAVADDLKSQHSTSCEWFICDDDQSGTRFFVIQGSESLASWQANLLFEPIQFEGLDVLVHRGIYEAAKGIYEQMLPEVYAHLKLQGDHATFRFTGHSLGGSLALLIDLMLLIRQELPRSSLLPVITFGAPSVMCGGDTLLQKLGVPRSHVQAVTMHRDIVPRAFSCNFPNHFAELLKVINGNLRSHPCLNKHKLLYAPIGELIILQPEEKFSPHHDLLPSGSGLYLLSCSLQEFNDADKLLNAAQLEFMNSPHPLEILSDRSAYGFEGTIQRDHDLNSYLKSMRSVILQELNHIRKAKREHRHKAWWPLLALRGGVDVHGRLIVWFNIHSKQLNLSRILRTGRESLRRFSRMVSPQHTYLLLVLLFLARLLLLGAHSLFR